MGGESSADLTRGAPAIVAWVRFPAITSWTPHARGNLMDGACTTRLGEDGTMTTARQQAANRQNAHKSTVRRRPKAKQWSRSMP